MHMLVVCSAVESSSSTLFHKSIYLLVVSGEVTTGGSVYLSGANDPVSSPTGGKSVLFAAVDVVGTDRALSARRLSCGGPIGGDPLLLLLLRSRVSTGDTGCDCTIGI